MRKFPMGSRGAGLLVLAAALSVVLPPSVASAQMHGMPAAAAGMSAPSVMAVQDALAREGFPLKVDGVLGPATREAIKAFQARHQLPVTGAADAATLAKLNVGDAGHAAHASPATPHATHGRPAPQGAMTGGGMTGGGMAGSRMMSGGKMHGGKMQGGMMHGGMMKGRGMPDGMSAQCGDMHQQMRQMMAQMQEMMKTMQTQMQAPKPN